MVYGALTTAARRSSQCSTHSFTAACVTCLRCAWARGAECWWLVAWTKFICNATPQWTTRWWTSRPIAFPSRSWWSNTVRVVHDYWQVSKCHHITSDFASYNTDLSIAASVATLPYNYAGTVDSGTTLFVLPASEYAALKTTMQNGRCALDYMCGDTSIFTKGLCFKFTPANIAL